MGIASGAMQANATQAAAHAVAHVVALDSGSGSSVVAHASPLPKISKGVYIVAVYIIHVP